MLSNEYLEHMKEHFGDIPYRPTIGELTEVAITLTEDAIQFSKTLYEHRQKPIRKEELYWAKEHAEHLASLSFGMLSNACAVPIQRVIEGYQKVQNGEKTK